MKITPEISYISIFISILLVVAGQIFIKKGSINTEFSFTKTLMTVKNILINKWLLAGMIFTLIAPLFYFLALKNIDLSVAYGINSLNYLFVSIAGWLIWKEKISISKSLGLLFIIIGVVFINLK